jgi:hypothetical protein
VILKHFGSGLVGASCKIGDAHPDQVSRCAAIGVVVVQNAD